MIKEIEWKGCITGVKGDVERVFFEHYRSLFAYRSVGIESFKADFLGAMPRLDDVKKERFEQPISIEEVERAIDHLNPGKSPGLDGLGAAFYKEFKKELSPILVVMYNEALHLELLPPSHASSHTVLNPKSDQTEKLRFVTSYRPISLTNVDYKI